MKRALSPLHRKGAWLPQPYAKAENLKRAPSHNPRFRECPTARFRPCSTISTCRDDAIRAETKLSTPQRTYSCRRHKSVLTACSRSRADWSSLSARAVSVGWDDSKLTLDLDCCSLTAPAASKAQEKGHWLGVTVRGFLIAMEQYLQQAEDRGLVIDA